MTSNRKPHRYALCIDNGGYPESLEVRKVYAVLPDGQATENNYIRVIDETGEDYLYPQKYFAIIEVPEYAAEAILDHATSQVRDVS
ncbi:MAG TPA: hypothetical protein VLL54_06355 [Pyrinomonadaceae bacterium]|nr:hypothetical protein [Pyrinomonadaceae bacterium]